MQLDMGCYQSNWEVYLLSFINTSSVLLKHFYFSEQSCTKDSQLPIHSNTCILTAEASTVGIDNTRARIK